VAAITPDDVDMALAALLARGRLRPLRGKDTARTGAPLREAYRAAEAAAH